MLRRSFATRDKVSKMARPNKKALREPAKVVQQQQQMMESPTLAGNMSSTIVTIAVGPARRLFACHEDVLCISPFFSAALRDEYSSARLKQVELPEEEPEVFSSILEYLYKGDYYPRLLLDKRRNTWSIEDATVSTGQGGVEPTVYSQGSRGIILKDTAIYCAAELFGLEELKRIALRKQGLRVGIQIDVILRSARFAYEHTPEQDAKLRAHYLALIIRSRKAFKRSGTMQMEMELGGSKLFFDLFVAMCNHIDDVVELANVSSPKTI